MATHSRILDLEIPWREEPGVLQSTGLQRVGYDLVINNNKNSCIAQGTLLNALRDLNRKEIQKREDICIHTTALQIAEERRETKNKGERERYTN